MSSLIVALLVYIKGNLKFKDQKHLLFTNSLNKIVLAARDEHVLIQYVVSITGEWWAERTLHGFEKLWRCK